MILAEREIPRLLSCEDVALFVHDVSNVSLLLSFCAPLSSCPRAARGPPLPLLSSRPLRCVPSRYSFVLPRLPSLVVLADAMGDSTPRRDVTRTMISIFFLSVPSIDPPTQNVILLCAFSLRKRFKNISNELRSIEIDYIS